MASLRAIIAAAGSGQRFDPGTPKQLVEVAGRTVLEWSVARLVGEAVEVVVAVPAGLSTDIERRLAQWPEVYCVEGGETRWRSVRRALDALEAAPDDLVAVHDGARPALAAEDLTQVVAAAAQSGAAVLGRAVSDTLKRVSDGHIRSTVDRRGLFRAETPQVFRRDLLARAFAGMEEGDGSEPTDESALVERLGVPIVAVAAAHPNPKLTVPSDLPLLTSLLRAESVVTAGP